MSATKMITSVTIRRFKQLQELTIPLTQLTLLVGANNSGKSSILQAVHFAISLSQSAKLAGGVSWKNDTYEGVMAEAVYEKNENAKLLRQNWCEDAILSAMGGYLPFTQKLGLEPPFWIFASLVGCEGARFVLNQAWGGDFSAHAIDREIIYLPESRIDSFDADPVQHLRPMLDVLWNSVGLEKSLNYDEQGNRNPRR